MISKSDYDVTNAIRFFNNFSVEVAFLVPTTIGLTKSILDATAPLRLYLKDKGIHDYNGQRQGDDGKKIVSSFFVAVDGLIPTKASLYRPFAKGGEGDPRIWFSKLKTYASPNNLLAVVAFKECLYVVNVSDAVLRESALYANSPLSRLLREVREVSQSVADELLGMLKDVASRGWIPTRVSGDTGIGATLEALLGITANSSPNPDYKGIEVKAKRLSGLRVRTRSNLFAQVPDWEISKLKSSSEILDKYGYYKGSIRRLYCTVRSRIPNPQGLMLAVDEPNDLLREVHKSSDTVEDVVKWKFDVLRKRLLTKHNETFWVGAKWQNRGGVEHFHYVKVIHTRLPFASNFHTLCDEGVITLDHLIKREEGGHAKEKGPIFKIKESNFDLLFPPPIEVSLVS